MSDQIHRHFLKSISLCKYVRFPAKKFFEVFALEGTERNCSVSFFRATVRGHTRLGTEIGAHDQ